MIIDIVFIWFIWQSLKSLTLSLCRSILLWSRFDNVFILTVTKLLFTYITYLKILLYLNVYHLKYTRYWNYWAAYVVGIHFLFDIINISLQFEIFDISHYYLEYYLHFIICLVFSTIFRLETSQNKIECREVWREAFGRE